MTRLCNVRVKLTLAMSAIDAMQLAYEQGIDTGPVHKRLAQNQIKEAIDQLREIEGV